jgi:hypothetical protein
VDYWTKEFITAYETVTRNILISKGDFAGNAISLLENIERDNTLKVYASEWELDYDDQMVLTKDGKVVLNKEPSWTLLKLIGKQLNIMVFALVQMGTS